jgi:hypothetical protein
MSDFKSIHSILDRFRNLMGQVYHLGPGKYSGAFGQQFMSRVEVEAFLNEQGGADFPKHKLELKSCTRKNGMVTQIEVAADDIIKWMGDPHKFIRRHGANELGDGYTRLDRRVDAKLNSKWLTLSYDGEKFVRMPTKYILNRYNIKLRFIALVEAALIAPRLVKPYRMSLIDNPEFTIETISEMLESGKLRIESRIKTNPKRHLVHRFIFKMSVNNMKVMTQKTKTQTLEGIETKAEGFDFELNETLDQPVYSDKLPTGYSISFPSGQLEIIAVVRAPGKKNNVSMRLVYLTPALGNEYRQTIDPRIQRDPKNHNIESLYLAFGKGRGSLVECMTFYDDTKKKIYGGIKHLVDGQNRCAAVMKSGVPLPVWVFTTDDETVFKKTDTGSARSFSDRNGRADSKTGPGVNFILKYKEHAITLDGGDVVRCRSDADDYYEKNQAAVEDAVKFIKRLGTKPIVSPSQAVALIQLASEKPEDATEVREFVRKIIVNDGLQIGTAMHGIRQWLEKRKAKLASGERNRPETNFCQLMTAWNAHMTNQPFKAMRGIKGTGVPCPRLYWETTEVSEDWLQPKENS